MFSRKEGTDLLEVKAMRDVISSHEGSQQMGDGTSLTTVRPEHECVHPPLSGKYKINRYYRPRKGNAVLEELIVHLSSNMHPL